MNVILFIIDSLNPKRLDCYDYDKITAPQLSNLFKTGLLFKNCFSNASFSPLGHRPMYNGRINIVTKQNPCFREMLSPTLAEVFKKNNYETACFVSLGPQGSKFEFNKGFDFFDEPLPNMSHPFIWPCNRTDYYTDIDNKKHSFYMGNYWLDKYLNILESYKSKKFFICGLYSEVHRGAERVLPSKYINMFGGDFENYDEKIRWMDDTLIQKTIEKLEELKIKNETIIIITADHGDSIGKHNEQYHGISVYDEPMRVPLIIIDPRMKEKIEYDNLCRTIDIPSTILDLLNIEIPKEFEGISLVKNFDKETNLVAYMENYGTIYSGEVRCLRTNDFKFIKKYNDVIIEKHLAYAGEIPLVIKNDMELYNVREDPGELVDLSSDPKYKNIVDLFNLKLDQMVSSVINIKDINYNDFCLKEI